MVNKLRLTFKKVVLFSVLVVMLGVSMVYSINYGFNVNYESKPEKVKQVFFASPDQIPSPLLPPIHPGPNLGYLLVFAYSGTIQPDGNYTGSFVQASVTVTGPLPDTNNYTGTTTAELKNSFIIGGWGESTTDLQNPLIFPLSPGEYYVSGTYGSAQQNATVDVQGWASVVFNFGSSPFPTFYILSVEAWYTPPETYYNILHASPGEDIYIAGGINGSTPVQASVTVTGMESYDGMTITHPYEHLVFILEPGEYLVSATYDSEKQYTIVNMESGESNLIRFSFGSSEPFLPP